MSAKNRVVGRQSIGIVILLFFMGSSFARQNVSPSTSASSQSSKGHKKEDPQEDKPIKLSSELVTVLTTVTDTGGNLVNNLTKDDFEVYENNSQQELAGLYREEQKELRLVFLFDTSGSIRSRFDFEKRAAALFFRQVLRHTDQAAIISVSTDSTLENKFTADPEKLVGTLDRLQIGGATALYQAVYDAALYLRKAPGRHVIVVLSDGTDTASGINLAAALREVQKSDAVIYAIHSTGVAASVNLQELGGEYVLKAMGEDTGGKAFFPPVYKESKKETQDLDEIYKRVAAEIRAQYVLTYYSGGGARGQRFQEIKVKVKRPDLLVQARRGYYLQKD